MIQIPSKVWLSAKNEVYVLMISKVSYLCDWKSLTSKVQFPMLSKLEELKLNSVHFMYFVIFVISIKD